MSDVSFPAEEKALTSAIDQIYASVEEPELWPETIREIGRLVGGGNHFWSADDVTATAAACGQVFQLSRADLRAVDQYTAEFDDLIAQFLRLVFLSVLWSQKDVSAREALGARMAKRYLQGREARGSEVQVARRLIIAMWEDARMVDFRHLHYMRLLVPHLDRAARLQMRLNLLTLRSELASGALDNLTVGVIMVDQAGANIWYNRRAKEIASDPSVLSLSGSRLIGRDASSTRSVRELISRAVAGEPGLLPIERDGLKPLLLIATPLRPANTCDLSPRSDEIGYGVIFISDPDQTKTINVESLQRAFDLTCREAQTAIAIAHGQGLKTAARSMGVAPTTVRSQLQQVFAKTGTNHQAELAALIHRTFTHLR